MQSAEFYEASPKLSMQVSVHSNSFWALLPPQIAALLQKHTDKYLTGITSISITASGITLCANPNHLSRRYLMTPNLPRSVLSFIVSQAQRQGTVSAASRITTSGLHRVGITRTTSKAKDVTAITIRIGRVVSNQAKLLDDLLISKDHEHKSILVLGPPGSGKTTLLRDIAKQLRLSPHETFVIDTWSELGGGGTTGFGEASAIRCVVAERHQQGAVIRDCLQNHNVRALIVDEAEQEDDFMALWAAKERGVRLIVGLQGTFSGLLRRDQQGAPVLRTAVTTRMGGVSDLLSTNEDALFSLMVEINTEESTSVKVTPDFGVAASTGFQHTGSNIRCFNSATGAICLKRGT